MIEIESIINLRTESTGLATFPVTNRGPELFRRFNIRTEIKRILIRIIEVALGRDTPINLIDI